jgi:hypothetical protein
LGPPRCSRRRSRSPERLVWPDIGGLRWRSLLFGGVVLGVSVAAIGSWAHRPRDATVCERDGVTGRMACSYGQTNIAEQRRAANEYLGGGGPDQPLGGRNRVVDVQPPAARLASAVLAARRL